MHVFVSIIACHAHTLVLNKNAKIIFFMIVTLMTLNLATYQLMTETIKHSLLWSLMFQFCFLQLHSSIVLVTPE